ncbi:DUF6880 family protein [Sphingomonas xinjiangensis]|uniref:Uncharacterized protein n=1 Tax=Sphingomonas xinjiangensis TaxID=643568 RepID=A0A840YTQ2_9SPHN|nr:DUF6880 family protein [Sphingomonas xinjiangensis]MBB5713101.1 hypothetical protein [Sphingomonas xinjiangensis]
MPSETTLNVKNLAALGAERLAELLLAMTAGDAAAKRRLRLELASRSGGDVASEIRKRLVFIAKSRSFVDWRKVKELARDLEAQRAAIAAHVAATSPGQAFDLLWRMLEMAPSIYERCDDSNGSIGSIIASVRDDLGAIAAEAGQPVGALADRVFQAVCANDYGQFDELISLTAPALGPDGLNRLKVQFEELGTTAPLSAAGGKGRVVGLSTRGPIYQEDYERGHNARLVRSALTEIADALGDVDGFAGRYSDEERANPAIAAAIAERMLAADRANEALAALDGAADGNLLGGHWPDWQRVRIEVLDALGRSGDAQDERWQAFERGLDAGYLRAHLKRLPDFDDIEAEERALSFASCFASFHQALAFLIDWPALDRAAGLIMARTGELDGDHYWLLTPAADALEQRHPLAATLVLRAMIDRSLDAAKYKRYGHAARHLQTCEHLARRIDNFAVHPNHVEYVADLRRRHGRKSGFWNA